MSAGGSRPGAGRPKKTEKFGGHILAVEAMIAERLPKLFENLCALADGVTVQETGKDGELKVYTKPPDYKANEYLINRIMGKPTERHEVTGEDGEPLRHAINLTVLTKTDLDALDRIVSQLDLDGPARGPDGDPGGEVPPVAG